MPTYSVKCISVAVSADGKTDTLTVEQRNLPTDVDPIRTFPCVVPSGSSTASIVAQVRDLVADWQHQKDAAATATAAAAAEAARISSLIGASTNVTV